MKKLLFVLVAFAAMIFSACSNEDISIETKGKTHDVKVNVNLSKLYDTFGLTDKLKDRFLRDKSGAVGVITYLYDNQGRLTDSKTMTSFTTSAMDIVYQDVEEGSYTLVAIETLVDPDDNNQPDAWEIIGSEKMSTLAIKQTDHEATPYAALAVANATVNVSDKDVSMNVTPSVLGSYIQFYAYNVDNLDAVNIGYGTTDNLDRYMLDPTLNYEDRYVVDLSQKDYFTLRGFLAKNSFMDEYHLISYVLEDEVSWSPCIQDDSNAGSSTWSVYNSKINTKFTPGGTYYIAYYYLDNVGVGVYDIFNSYSEMTEFVEQCEEYNEEFNAPSIRAPYNTPYINWSNGSVSAVKNSMSNYTLMNDIARNDDGSYYMMYLDETGQTIYQYVFTSSTNGLTDSYVYMERSTHSVNEIHEYLTTIEGYQYNGENDGDRYYMDETRTTGVLVYEVSELLVVNYYSVSAYNVSPRKARTLSPKTESINIPVPNLIRKQEMEVMPAFGFPVKQRKESIMMMKH